MKITFDAAKHAATLKERGLDFADAALVFAGRTFSAEAPGATMAKFASTPSANWPGDW